MKYVDEYRDHNMARAISGKIFEAVTRPWNIMEICGGQTHAIMKYNLQEFLPDKINLIHGPGCPVCVTPLEKIDKALAIAAMEDVIFTSFGDMIRVPGSKTDLFGVKASGGDVRMVYSPLDAVKIAAENPGHRVVFFAIGFETTAPANALSVLHAEKLGLTNYSVLSSHVLVPPAMELILSSPGNRVQGFLAAGHVCTVMGYHEYPPIAEKYGVPISVTGFEPVDILQGILATVRNLETGKAEVSNEYRRSVTFEGNRKAQEVVSKVFEKTDQSWRGIGLIPASGLGLRNEYSAFDASRIFPLEEINPVEPEICIAGEILQGKRKPVECKAYGTLCTPENPLGAPMVSHEGACSAYYRYKN
ncbi:MAG: hydrogenase formation protein HypD [Bacteroidia bacterium]|nr:MAG: hydrogenase formation protein HypD [Bacteroidia bacterium]